MKEPLFFHVQPKVEQATVLQITAFCRRGTVCAG